MRLGNVGRSGRGLLAVQAVCLAFGGWLAATAQEAETTPAPVPWQKIELWATSAPESPPAVKEPAKVPAKDPSAETAKDAPKDTAKEALKDPPKDTPKEPVVAASIWAPTRPGERRPEPPAWKTLYDQVLGVLGQRMRETQSVNFKRQAEICLLLEQYDKAFQLLSQMLNEPKRWKEEIDSGWVNGHLWECALFCRNKPPAAWVQQQFEEWKVKEPARLEAFIAREGYGSAYRERMMKAFREKQEYFTKEGSTIAEKVKDLELKGDTNPEALLALRQRCMDRRPAAALTHLRVLVKLRDWYPDLPETKSGEMALAVARHLGHGFGMYREGSKEAESLMEKAPGCAEVTSGAALYYAAEFAYQQAEHMAPDAEDGWTLSDRTRPIHKEAREYWSRARQLFLRLKKEYPKNDANAVDGTTGLSTVDSRLNYIARPERLGPPKP